MRASSTTCTITCQPSWSSRCTPSTDSTGLPSSAGSSSRTVCTASAAVMPLRFPRRARLRSPSASSLRLPFGLLPLVRRCCSAMFGILPGVDRHLLAALLRDRQPLQQLVLAPPPFLIADESVLGFHLQLQQLAADPVLVVELSLNLIGDLLGDPGDAADGSQRQREQSGEQSHRHTPAVARRTNECGGSGPVYLKRSRPACAPPIWSTRSSNSAIRSRSTRKDALSAIRSWPGSPDSTASASGASSPRIVSASVWRDRSTAAATRSPSSIRA